ncbi:MAG TPA: ornithine cyclodeaminase family protein [Thermodesulfobacteriota bacterium]|nr:ornithine cyclodeaminase family protein [Thermodesulfobacteriota bacterium]
MSVRVLTESEVARLLSVGEAMTILEAAFREAAAGRAALEPRRRVVTPPTVLHTMSATLPTWGVTGLKAYVTTPRGSRFVVLVFDAGSGEPVGLLAADRLGRIRTGAATGLATRLLARPDAAVGALIGTGRQAETQLEAICLARPLAEVRVFSRDPARRAAFVERMGSRVPARLVAASSAEAAVRGADVVVTITNARQPVLHGAWLEPGAHVNAAGVNWPDRRELDEAAVRRASRIVVDDLATARLEAGDLLPVVAAGHLRWEEVVELAAVVAGAAPGRQRADEITLFSSQGTALEDLACAARVLERARADGVGRDLPLLE